MELLLILLTLLCPTTASASSPELNVDLDTPNGRCVVEAVASDCETPGLHLLQRQASKLRRDTTPPSTATEHSRPKRAWKLREGARLNEVLVVPSLKLVFCFIPKNACTQFNRLMNALNGIGEKWNGAICGARDPNYKSSMYSNFTALDLERALSDPAWTKATFLRDPVERFVSAFRSKCLTPRECGGCLELESSADQDTGIDEAADALKYTQNAHFMPQSSLCGGLAETIGAYDYVGHISSDTHAVYNQVKEMLQLAFRKKSAMGSDSKDYPVSTKIEQRQAELPSATVHSSMLGQQSLVPFGEALSSDEADALRLADQFFPSAGPSSSDPHIHLHRPLNASYLLRDMFSLQKVLSHFEDDYDKLPGLTRPAWTHRVSSFYDAFGLFSPRPKWLNSEHTMEH